jgi:ribonuclease HI
MLHESVASHFSPTTGIAIQVVKQESIGWVSTYGVLSTEIAVVAAALECAQEHTDSPPQYRRLELVVFTDSQHALRAIQAGNDARSRRELLQKISRHIVSLYRARIDLQFRWSPGYSGITGNEQADKVAKDTSSQTGTSTALVLERVREVAGVIRLTNRDSSDNPTPFDTIRVQNQE